MHMRQIGNNSSILVMLTLLWGVAAQAQARQHLLPPSPAERAALEKKLDPALMPAGARHRNIDPKQVFKLVGPLGKEVTVAPVDFMLPNPHTADFRHSCGIYVVPSQRAPYFLDATPDDDDLWYQCWQVLSVRLVRNEGNAADIVFVGDTSLNTHDWRQDYVLHKGKDGIYKLSVDYKDAPQEQ